MGRDTVATVRVPAKVNLFLAVRGLRQDGYHELVTILQTVWLRDRVRVSASPDLRQRHPSLREVAVTFDHDQIAGVPIGVDNLCVRAAHRFLEHLGLQGVSADPDATVRLGRPATPRLSIRLDKDIPVAAGMAGGSADAAATLLAINDVLEAGLDRAEVQELAADLGADVPFCVSGGTALATGTGTATAQVLCRGEFHWVIGMSAEPLATPEVYAQWDELETAFEMHPDQVLQAVRTGDAELLGASLHNDLQAAAFRLRPDLAEGVDQFLVDGALGSIVSGSGPTVVALAADAAHAHELAGMAADRFDRVEVAKSPAGGPSIHRE
ncbi:4-(cytidine 5'-diphospho)-2-C-methyl-D-erythritol kinase [Salsipaludibacter albus]|uniref:4-(cytidine 5'-diphospho)-2-C-methyl-D-erythritol kinase n=1 Tax=Salsipaludibacter albus TaxID=2849650 RepID=UPI001EE3FBA6|nr:4-(cytidine 5'-diphospho)-2-C-methyl-D-erythritol kinase [Salsipaludibacter albus]